MHVQENRSVCSGGASCGLRLGIGLRGDTRERRHTESLCIVHSAARPVQDRRQRRNQHLRAGVRSARHHQQRQLQAHAASGAEVGDARREHVGFPPPQGRVFPGRQRGLQEGREARGYSGRRCVLDPAFPQGQHGFHPRRYQEREGAGPLHSRNQDAGSQPIPGGRLQQNPQRWHCAARGH